MSNLSVNFFLNEFYMDFGSIIGQNIPKILAIMMALIGLYFGICKFVQWVVGDGTTSWLGSHWAWYDRHTYRPWKGYNRLHSKRWNIEHME